MVVSTWMCFASGRGPAFDDVQGVAMRTPVFVGPHLRILEPGGIDHECVAVPVAHFVAKKRWVRILRVLAPVGGNQPVVTIEVKEGHELGSLKGP